MYIYILIGWHVYTYFHQPTRIIWSNIVTHPDASVHNLLNPPIILVVLDWNHVRTYLANPYIWLSLLTLFQRADLEEPGPLQSYIEYHASKCLKYSLLPLFMRYPSKNIFIMPLSIWPSFFLPGDPPIRWPSYNLMYHLLFPSIYSFTSNGRMWTGRHLQLICWVFIKLICKLGIQFMDCIYIDCFNYKH